MFAKRLLPDIMFTLRAIVLALFCGAWAVTSAKNILLTNDDGWAVAQIRAQFSALVEAGHDVCFSCHVLFFIVWLI